MEMDNVFKPCNRKHGYSDLQKIGFYCYKSDNNGDHHKNDKIPNMSVLGSYRGYEIYVNDHFIIKEDDIDNLKVRINNILMGVV